MGKFWRRLAFFLQRKRLESEMEEEMRFHLDMKTEAAIEDGLPENQARYRAVRGFGNALHLREQSRDVWGAGAFENLARDLHYSVRVLRKDRTFAVMSLLGLGLGMGLCTSIFTMVNVALFQRPPIKDPATYVALYSQDSQRRDYDWFSYPQYVFLREHNTVLQGVTAWSGRFTLLWTGEGSGNGEEIEGRLASANEFEAYVDGISTGRGFLPEEDRTPGSHAVVVLNPNFWRSRFASDPAILGKTLRLSGRPFTVVGIAAHSYSAQNDGEVYIPVTMMAQAMPGTAQLTDPSWRGLSLRGRLKPGVSVEQAQVELTALLKQFEESRGAKSRQATVVVWPGGEFPGKRRQLITAMLSTMLAVGMILLIACTNTANLLLARASARQKEIGVRLSLGASRGRLIQQLLTESMLLALGSGILGMVLSVWLVKIFAAMAKLPEGFDLSPDIRVYGFVLVLSLVTGVAFGLAPALRASTPNLTSALKREGLAAELRRGDASLWAPRHLLIVAPLAISLILLIGAGFLVRGLQKSYGRDRRIKIENFVAMSFNLDLQGYDDSRATAFEQDLLRRVEQMPGVSSVALTRGLPAGNQKFRGTPIAIEGWEIPPGGDLPGVAYNIVTPSYFTTVAATVLRGRGFTAEDTSASPGVVVINEDMGRKFWPGQDAIGKRLRTGAGYSYFQVIGIVKDACLVRNVCDDDLSIPQPVVYVALPQSAQFNQNSLHAVRQMRFLIRVDGGPETVRRIIPALRAEASSFDADLRVVVSPLADVAEDFRPLRLMVLVTSTLGSLAMMLAAIGIYGVMAYAVSQRTREVGIRMALGARKVDVLVLILGRSFTLIAAGTVVGLAGSWALSRGVSRFLVEIGGLDPVAFGAAAALLATVAMVASYVPARRAAKVDLMVSLRCD